MIDYLNLKLKIKIRNNGSNLKGGRGGAELIKII